MSALGNRVHQQYSKSEDHADSDIEDIMEEVNLNFTYIICPIYFSFILKLELVDHIPHVPWCIASATDGFDPGEIHSIERAQDSLVQACAVVSIGVSDIGMATMGNKTALFVMLVDHIPRFEAY